MDHNRLEYATALKERIKQAKEALNDIDKSISRVKENGNYDYYLAISTYEHQHLALLSKKRKDSYFPFTIN
jgi:hypothetical protein